MSNESRSPQAIEIRIQEVLEAAGYRREATPIVVAGIPFDVAYAFTAGLGFIDLVLVLDERYDRNTDAQRNYWLVERIARALDNAGSRRPLSVVLITAPSGADWTTRASGTTDALLRLARVLEVSDPSLVAEQLAPMLPLIFEPAAVNEADPLSQLSVSQYQARDQEPVRKLVNVARHGSKSVEQAFASWLDGAFATTNGEV